MLVEGGMGGVLGCERGGRCGRVWEVRGCGRGGSGVGVWE